MERDISDEEDDRENLIEQHDRKQQSQNNHILPTSSPRRSTFHIEDLALRRRFLPLKKVAMMNKWFLCAIFLPLLIVIVYISSPDIRSFSSFSLKMDSEPSDRMRESELQALYLLRKQRNSIISLFNKFLSNSSLNSTSSVDGNLNSLTTLSNLRIEDLESALRSQISLNNQIQQLLLSYHKPPNSNASINDTGTDPVFGFGVERCRKVDRVRHRGSFSTVEWKPSSDKFLFAICLSGQMSNHLICLEKHMFFAALLNRVLVLPTSSNKFDYRYSRVLDYEHINACLGRKVVVSFEEFEAMRKNHVHIDRFICYFSSPTPCYVDDDHVKRLKGLGISMAKLESPWKEDISKPSKRTVEDVKAKFASNDDVIAIGDVFYADVEQGRFMLPGGPIAHKCKTLIEPNRLILLTAQRFIQTFLGKNFVALHFRRHGFLKFCNAKKPSCFYPVPQAADCILRVLERVDAPVIYLSTDAADSETGLLQSLVVHNGKTILFVKRPPRNSAEKWDALLYRHELEEDPQVEAMLDKTICAMSTVFIGAFGSTFTEDILRLRKDWETVSSCDEYLCQGELPNFIAEKE